MNMKITNLHNRMDSSRVARAALQVFFYISEEWCLSESQERALLGEPDYIQFSSWKKTKTDIKLSYDVLAHISCLICIYKSLHILLPTKKSAYEWPRKTKL